MQLPADAPSRELYGRAEHSLVAQRELVDVLDLEAVN